MSLVICGSILVYKATSSKKDYSKTIPSNENTDITSNQHSEQNPDIEHSATKPDFYKKPELDSKEDDTKVEITENDKKIF